MKIATWGSKICDDALKYSRNESVCRIVEISPFSLLTQNFNKMQNIQREWSIYGNNDYLNKIISLDYSKQVLNYINSSEPDLIVISLDSMRRYLREFSLSNGTNFRIQEDNTVIERMSEIKQCIEEDLNLTIVGERVLRPMFWNDEQLKIEIEHVCDIFKKLFDINKVVLLKTHNVYQYIDANVRIVSDLERVDVVNRQNEFYDKCIMHFIENIKCKVIECPQILLGDSRRGGVNIFHFSMNYYEYINKCIDAIGMNEYTDIRKKEILNEYLVKQQVEIQEIILRPIVDLAFHRRNGRKLVLVGESEVFEYNLKKKYGLKVDIRIPYGEKCDIEEIKTALKSIQYRNREYFCIVPFIKGDVPILKLLWTYGYGYGKGYICSVHNPVVLRKFKGVYEDFYNNRIECNRATNIELRGIGNKVCVGNGNTDINGSIIILSQTNIQIEDGVEFKKEGFTSTLYDGATLNIGANAVMDNAAHIRGTFFSTTSIGANSYVGKAVVIFNGDGHSIFDLHTGENINYNINNSPEYKREIIIGENVYIGDRSFVLSGTNIPSECIVRDNSFVNKVFYQPCLIAGNPARMIEEVK